jgi:hypothetical protein
MAFNPSDIFFQTRESYRAENFFIDHYNWTKPNFILANFRVANYFESKLTGNAHFSADPRTIKEVDTIFYTVGLGLQMQDDYTIEKIINDERLNVIYSSGFSIVATSI